ncbi:kinesin-like protein Klp10A isoform X2 [Tribolium castaneum]|uniref:Kinesin-like protein n=1 Tax=Tribolium castaneum TaxID=7070 RepID=D6W736_TRICA|nr:PREDICTED: kinesin-like protein Klp10A isoform X2 [Tribolium castaneum]EFA11416.2 Kinesin-like protein Klp10A [Tribolium castaneum]|eukprot:XP_008193441.1 PREDICTED: kinesin-like protein Klp10A isoform X2 [Tribolium castaneum]
MDQQDILQVGTSINIKRTDGRVHSAIVAAVNFDLRSATVEWFEQGETKGKEVDMTAITSLNPDIKIVKPGERYAQEPTTIPQTQTSGNILQRNPTRQSVVPNVRHNNGFMRSAQQSTRVSQNQVLSNNGHTMPSSNDSVPNKESNLPTSRASVQNIRRSNVLKEVEKLKKNREERRQRQAEEKAEKEAFLQLAPGNPHWELLNMIAEYRRGLDIKPLTENDAIEDHLITVCVRKRPLNKKEIHRKEVDVITIPSKNQLIVHEPKNKVDLTKYLENQLFRFDYAFDETCSNEMVYRYTAQPLIKTIFEGGFATCFAYGQTGSGKTHTMGGDFNGKNQDCHKGIYAMASADVFRLANSPKYRHLGLVVSSSFFEIYSGKVFDLLNNKSKLRILEDGKQQVQVVGLTEKVVCSVDEVLKLIQKGNQARTSGQTFANSNSSRSHAVFQIYLRSNNNMQKIHGKFSLIDLAGNERGADTSSANRQTRMEGAEINKSLLALKECIRALGRKGAHLPFRVSKLTQVLRDSFVGSNSRTCMIAMVSPGVNSCEHTLNTLRYADRVKELGGGDLQTNTLSDEQQGDGDLMQLRSLNENDMTPEMLNFHQVISELEVAEENMLDNHKQTVDDLLGTYEKAVSLLRMTDEVTYDQEAYCKNWEDLIDNTLAYLVRSQEIVADYKAKMSAEEQLSRKTKRK